MHTSSCTLPSSHQPFAPFPLRDDFQRNDLLASLRGPSETIGRLWAQARVLAPHVRTLLLSGERGCGSETLVRLLQGLSPFHAGPLVILDASSEAASVAKRLRSPKRLLQGVAGGVLYLHDVDRLSPESQADVLRFLRSNRHHLCAVIAFSHQNLHTLAAANNFSPALADTLSSLTVPVPSLRDRQADIPSLADLYVRQGWSNPSLPMPSFDASFLEAATAYSWPGNLEQFRATMQRLIQKAAADQAGPQQPIKAADLEVALTELSHTQQTGDSSGTPRLVKLDQVVQEHIRSVLIACQGNKLRASEVLGISRSTLYRMLDATAPGALALFA